MDYKIARGEIIGALEIEVRKLMAIGYEPCGGHVFSTQVQFTRDRWTQAMVNKVKE